ncbi:hypothetical protein CN918_32440 [Priestia megaterium]|nr:hypothetical protein CN918_32440 [Priestia megaterium]
MKWCHNGIIYNTSTKNNAIMVAFTQPKKGEGTAFSLFWLLKNYLLSHGLFLCPLHINKVYLYLHFNHILNLFNFHG